MVRAILSLALGLALLVFGVVELGSWHDLPARQVPLVYVSVMMGLVISIFAILSIAFARRRRRSLGDVPGGDLWAYSAGSSDHHGPSHGGDCGHSGADTGDGGGGGGGDGGGGH
jgi:hypothetical protein